jgi:hypothetical protein
MLSSGTPPGRPPYWGHSASPAGREEPLKIHLERVAQRAACFAQPWGEREAWLAGLLHDLGKYGGLFQRRLQGKERGIDH